ncbi:hypothetical protein BFF78_00900 [Streptomyces fodineus]|uniref:Uncharacterized protein n=1 Tax=Streptomyces fodineus TaxID=1904616 RepID=A0A1D7Y2M7_9ACTN|nr:hypothetical protein BFF78_00900 [Streptomyces fodineus]
MICLATLGGWLVTVFDEVFQEAGDLVGDAPVVFAVRAAGLGVGDLCECWTPQRAAMLSSAQT